MKKLVAAGVIALAAALLATPALGDGPRRTELLKDGKAVDTLYMRSGTLVDVWVLNEQNVLVRDIFRDFYLVSLAEACDWIDLQENFRFVPALGGNVLASRPYEVRSKDERICDISTIRTVTSRDEAKKIAGE